MKPEEAIEILELPKDPLKSGTHYHAIPSLKRISYADYLSARKAAIQALEKQVAKKPNVKELPDAFGRLYWNVCGACDEEIESDYDYCPECGQRIDRGEIE